MRYLFLILLSFGTTLSRADFFSPFADSRTGMTVTDSGQFITIERKDGIAGWFIRCRTCTGLQDIPTKIPAHLLAQAQTNTPVKITVTINDTEDYKTKARSRLLEVIKIEARQ